MSKPSKPRITLADLAAVEIPKASLVTDALAPEIRDATGAERSLGELAERSEGAVGDEGERGSLGSVSRSVSRSHSRSNSGSVSRPLGGSLSGSLSGSISGRHVVPSDIRDMSAMPEGVSPEVAKLLAMPEPEPEPIEEAAPVAVAAVAAAEAAPAAKKSGKAGIAVLLIAIAAGAVGGWFAMQPPPMDATSHSAQVATATPIESPETTVGFQPIPAPIIVEPTPEPTRTTAPSGEQRRRRRADTEVRGGDLF